MSDRRWIGGVMVLGALAGLAAGLWLLRGAFGAEPVEPALAIDLLVDADDIYAVGPADLRRFGWDDVDPEDLRIEHAGEPYPFYLAGAEEDFLIVFYGKGPAAPHDRYTPFNVYRLFRDGDAERILRDDADPGAGLPAGTGENALRVEARIEENLMYLPALEEGRPWFWQQLAAPGEIEIAFDLPGYAGGEALLRISLFATTDSAEADPDHHVTVRLNGSPLADEHWDGSGARTIEIPAPETALLEMENRLVIEAPGDTGVAADIVALDRVAIAFDRVPELPDAPLHFTARSGSVDFLRPRGGDLFVFSLDSEERPPDLRILSAAADLSIPTTEGIRYAVGTVDILPRPAGLRAAALEPDLRSETGAAYLAIGAPELLAPLAPLLAHREAEGLTTMAVPLQAVYDQFGGGLQTPEAIRSFLKNGIENWTVKPAYILLVGDWTYDPNGYTSEIPEYGFPSFFVFTEFGGETVSDVAFVLLDGDELPDLALGRFPARTPERVETLVAKTLAFENRSGEDWTRRVLAVADGTEARFSGDAAAFLDGFGEGVETVLVDATGDGRAVAGRIESEIGSGMLIFSYFGHGSVTQFGKESLFTAADAGALSNGETTPILVSITCLAGLFTHPSVESLTETMLWNENGGAVAGLSATSLTLPAYQSYLSEGLAAGIASVPGGRLGQALLVAQRAMPLDLGRGADDVLLTFLLFGDPAILMPEY